MKDKKLPLWRAFYWEILARVPIVDLLFGIILVMTIPLPEPVRASVSQ
jgi:hypothetical protein